MSSLDDRVIIEIPISELIAGTNVRGSLAERVAAIRNEVREAMGRVVLFFDEIHTLFARRQRRRGRERAQARIGARRAALHRHHDARRVQARVRVRSRARSAVLGRRSRRARSRRGARNPRRGLQRARPAPRSLVRRRRARDVHHVVGALPAGPRASGQGAFDSRSRGGARAGAARRAT